MLPSLDPLPAPSDDQDEDAILAAAFAQAECAISILKNIVADGGPSAAVAQADLEMLATAAAA
ncbi:MAG: hypothetical protein JSR45_09980 [Proteobacteria bacterium]|nr:hypothetical protein [Pseudomonadota bacterium]